MSFTSQGKALVAHRFARSVPTYDQAAIVQRETAERMLQMLKSNGTPASFSRVLELGCGTGLLTDLLVRQLEIDQLTLNDLVPDLTPLVRRTQARRPQLKINLCHGDMELISLPSNQDLIVSNAAIQWTSRPGIMLRRMVAALAPTGILAIGTFGPMNMQETGDLTGSSLRYLALEELLAGLAPEVRVLGQFEQIRTIRFPSAYAVLRHLKQTGVNSLQQQSWSPRTVRDFCQLYESRFGTANDVPLTYHPIIVVAQRGHTPGF